jgi:hypothetical protein
MTSARTAQPVPTTSGPDTARGQVEQTSPAPHVDDVIAAAAALAVGVPRGDKASKEAEVLGVDYQQAGQVRQLLAERRNMVAYGNTERVAGIDSALAALGYTGDRMAGASGDPGPLGRSSRSSKAVRTDAPTADVAKANAEKPATTSGPTTPAASAPASAPAAAAPATTTSAPAPTTPAATTAPATTEATAADSPK